MEEETIVTETAEVDSYEEIAKEQGWKPKEEYQGDPNKWRPAKEFVDRGELFSKIDSLGRELKDTKKALTMLQEHHSKVRETEYKKALTELKTLQKKHLEEGNSDGYLETTELLTDLKAEQKAREVVNQTIPQQPQQEHPTFTNWLNENKWYQKNDEMRQFADAVGTGYAKLYQDLNPEEVLKYVTTQVKQRYKDFFVNPNRTKPGLVGTSDTVGESKGSFQMTDDEKKVMNTFVRQGIMSKDEYIKELKASKGVV
jgi:hypothetical protein